MSVFHRLYHSNNSHNSIGKSLVHVCRMVILVSVNRLLSLIIPAYCIMAEPWMCYAVAGRVKNRNRLSAHVSHDFAYGE